MLGNWLSLPCIIGFNANNFTVDFSAKAFKFITYFWTVIVYLTTLLVCIDYKMINEFGAVGGMRSDS